VTIFWTYIRKPLTLVKLDYMYIPNLIKVLVHYKVSATLKRLQLLLFPSTTNTLCENDRVKAINGGHYFRKAE